jgi:hypothetical protein
MDLTEYRESDSEKERTQDLLRIIEEIKPQSGKALDIGARDGHFSKLLAQYFDSVTALDLEKPTFESPKVDCVKGDVTALEFSEGDFNLAFCVEVLEHIPAHLLNDACKELCRVSTDYILIGVPYKQDIRLGRSTCYSCGDVNPPWGHVNSFDEKRLAHLFMGYDIEEISFVSKTKSYTNALSVALMDFAGNPYGTYSQGEPCIHCDKPLIPPPTRSFTQKVATKMAFYARQAQAPFIKEHANWVHVLFKKQ